MERYRDYIGGETLAQEIECRRLNDAERDALKSGVELDDGTRLLSFLPKERIDGREFHLRVDPVRD